MAVRTDAAVIILVTTVGYVRRFVTLTASGLTVPTPNLTPAGTMRRLNFQKPVKILLKTELRNQEGTSSLTLQTNRFLFSATWSQNRDLFGR